MQHWGIVKTGLAPRSLMMSADGAVGVPIGNDSFTKLLLHMDGTDASTTFTDSSASAHTVTANLNAQIDTAQFKFGVSSGLFDGADDYLNLDGHSDFAFGTGDFTVDCQLRLNATGATQVLYDARPAGTSGGLYPVLFVSAANVLCYQHSGAVQITGATTMTTGVWYHAAVARSGTSTKLFLNGTQEGSTLSDSNDYVIGTSRPALGASGNVPTSNELNGWMDEVRVSKGIARWTANFTPPLSAYI